MPSIKTKKRLKKVKKLKKISNAYSGKKTSTTGGNMDKDSMQEMIQKLKSGETVLALKKKLEASQSNYTNSRNILRGAATEYYSQNKQVTTSAF